MTSSRLRDELAAKGIEARFVQAPGPVPAVAGVAKMGNAEPVGFEFRLYADSDQATVRGLGRMHSTDFGWPKEQLGVIYQPRVRGVLGNVAFAEYEWHKLNTHGGRAAALRSQLAKQRLLRALDDALFGSFPTKDPYAHAVLPEPSERE
ncbi:MAG TPA: hypothetical protein VH042_04890 [Solirubrobacterales bacterium]|nr:hypothetical protein [Solirubrobacterales bacterium]